MNVNRVSQAQEPAGASFQPHTNPLRRILVVEDDQDIRCLNTELLMLSGYHVRAAEDGAAAWDALRDDSFDLVITDQSMPRMSGVELLEKLRSAGTELPVLMATGAVPEHVFNRQPWLRPTAMLLKPYTAEELLRNVKEVLQATECAREFFALPADWTDQSDTEGCEL